MSAVGAPEGRVCVPCVSIFGESERASGGEYSDQMIREFDFGQSSD